METIIEEVPGRGAKPDEIRIVRNDDIYTNVNEESYTKAELRKHNFKMEERLEMYRKQHANLIKRMEKQYELYKSRNIRINLEHCKTYKYRIVRVKFKMLDLR